MRSPDPLLVQRWLLHPRPTGGRRIAAAYLAAASGVAVSVAIITVSTALSGSCDAGDFTCLGSYFRGLVLAVVIGSAVMVAVSAVVKLGLVCLLGLIAAVPVIAALGVGLSLTPVGLLAVPLMIILAAAAPAGAVWTSTKVA